MSKMLEKLDAYFKNTPREQILKDWAETEKFDKVGPTIHELVEHLETYFKIPKQDEYERNKLYNLIIENPEFSGFFYLNLSA